MGTCLARLSGHSGRGLGLSGPSEGPLAPTWAVLGLLLDHREACLGHLGPGKPSWACAGTAI
eukprot:91851-Pyramimonas_sp.AAC.1